MKKFDKILISNRGEIACRIIKTARKMGIKTVALYTTEEPRALHARMADEAILIGDPGKYLSINDIIQVARTSGADALHPGYGFLSENAGLPIALVT
jgi:acetyl/propionyl-CoA carboxylase alpha subunit